jgi:glucosamine--fructose-6-phosphate aminotransferase (isomerizing)
MKSNIEEIKSRHQPNNRSVILTTKSDEDLKSKSDFVFEFPEPKHEEHGILGFVMWFHYLAFSLAKQKGYDIDQPRNLAKSVTVE